MPATQRGQVDKIAPGRYRLRWYDHEGHRKTKQPFRSKSAAWDWFRESVEPLLNGELAPLPALTLAEFVPLYLERHAASVRPRTIVTLRERLPHAVRAFGNVPLRDLERMSGEIATWQARLPERSRYGIVQALRQVLEAGVRWGHISKNPAKLAGRNRQPSPRGVRAFTRTELDAIAAEMSARYQPLPEFAAATGLRPEEWQALDVATLIVVRGLPTCSVPCRTARSWSLPRTAAVVGRCRCPGGRWPRSTPCRHGWIPRCYSQHRTEGCSTSTTSGVGNGHQRSRRAGSASQHGYTTYGPPSPRTPFVRASRSSSWPRSWGPASE